MFTPTYRPRTMAFTFHSCSGRRGPPLVDAVRCSCESDPAVRSCPLNRLSPAKKHASQLGHGEQEAVGYSYKQQKPDLNEVNKNDEDRGGKGIK